MPALRRLRRTRGLTLVDVARQSGLGARIIAEIEHGLRPFRDTERMILARCYGVDPADLYVEPVGAAAAAASLSPFHSLGQRQMVAGMALLSTLATFAVAGGDAAEFPLWSRPVSAYERTIEQPRAARSRATLTRPDDENRWTIAVTPLPQSGEVAFVPTPTPTHTPVPIPTPTHTPVPTATAAPPPPAPALPADHSVTMPLPSSGPFHQNVMVALEANGGGLQHIVIAPGEMWSFNRTVGDPGSLDLAALNGIYGGGWCDLASYYVVVLRPLLPLEAFHFTRHVDATGFGLAGIADADAVAIWNTNGAPGEQDLVVHNIRQEAIVVWVERVEGGVRFHATLREHH